MKVLLVDTGFSALPIYEYLTAGGHEVWAMGNRASDVVARRAGDRWIEQDYSRVGDVARHVERLNIERLVPGCTDVSIDTCVSIAGGSGYLDSKHANQILANKALFRNLCADLDLPAPRMLSPDELPRAGHFIAKPVDAFSGRGISVFDGMDPVASHTALDVAATASASGQVVLEPFIVGQLYSWSTFVETGRVMDGFFVREGSSANQFAVDTSYVDYSMPESCRATLSDAIARIAKELNLVDGLIHVQFIWTGQEPFIVEMARRCPGDLYSMLIQRATGYPYAGKYASYFLNEALDARRTERRSILRHTVTSLTRTILGELYFTRSLVVRSFYPLQAIGAELSAGHAGRIGIMFVEAEDEQEKVEVYSEFIQRNAYSIL